MRNTRKRNVSSACGPIRPLEHTVLTIEIKLKKKIVAEFFYFSVVYVSHLSCFYVGNPTYNLLQFLELECLNNYCLEVNALQYGTLLGFA